MIKKQQELVDAAAGRIPPDCIYKNAGIINVFTDEIEIGDVAVYKGYIVGIGNYSAEYEKKNSILKTGKNKESNEEYNCKNTEIPIIIDCTGKYLSPGFIDAHIHIESSMLSPKVFSDTVVPHGTTAVITDPHEIVNVAGDSGLKYMLKEAEQLPLKIYFMLPSCVPATALEESGAVIKADDLAPFMAEDQVLGLAEVMNFYGTVQGEEDLLNKIALAKAYGKIIDGHGPGLSGKALNAYVCAGVVNDHECSTVEEAMAKLSRGQWIMIREGTAAKNMEGLKALLKPPYSQRCMLVTDDKHPGELERSGHVDYLLQKAVHLGAAPVHAVKMVTLHPAKCYGLRENGAIAPGYKADLVILEDLVDFKVQAVYKEGVLVAENGVILKDSTVCRKEEGSVSSQKPDIQYEQERVMQSIHVKELEEEDFLFREDGTYMRVIELIPGELLTKELVLPVPDTSEFSVKSGIYLKDDIIKLAAIERHHNTGHIGLGLIKGYGLKGGAIASSVSHDAHNLIVAGCNEKDMVLAANIVRKNQGGLAMVSNGKVLGELPLPIGGLMSGESAASVDKLLEKMKKEAKKLGVRKGIDPFMTLAFISLSVIPELRLTTLGLARVNSQEICSTFFKV
ncbi:adenine deaminase [Anaerocolumna cellulosilytica]|nr:adenine deaminase [Anaerocolumna cellulosilytica]